MKDGKPLVLLIGEGEQGCSCLAKRLEGRGCECAFAISYQEACSIVEAHRFDLVLSPMRLHDTSLFALAQLLRRSGTTLFYYCPVEDGCWWVPALRCGENCFGSGALLPCELVGLLDQLFSSGSSPALCDNL
jgi:hypothetical protein